MAAGTHPGGRFTSLAANPPALSVPCSLSASEEPPTLKHLSLSAVLRSRVTRITTVAAIACASLFTANHIVRADAPKTAADYQADPAAMLDAYRHVEAASVSD